jgi:hypothetical protein
VDGTFSDGFGKTSAGSFSDGDVGVAAVVLSVAAVVLSLGTVSPFPAGVADFGDGGESTLPRMICKPSFPLSTITIFELDDCAS